MAGGTREQRIPHSFNRSAALGGESHAQRIGAIIGDYWRWGRLAFDHRSGVGCHFLRSEARTRRHRRIELEHHGGTADRVVDAVQYVDYAFDFADGIADL